MRKEIIINKNDNRIIKRIKELCIERDWSYYKMSQATDIPPTTISNMFKANTMPTISTVEKICIAFGITLAQFFQENDKYIDITSEQERIISIWNTFTEEKKQYCLTLMEGLQKI